ncbi:MAG: hypothetical protein JOZ41_20725 [Chloroflexi bacterium]|nr:hypothetical protein [Chloroflexota bacterium]
MSRELEPTEDFWTLDEELGEGVFFDDAFTIRARAHIREERYRGREELIRLSPSGVRSYVLMHPYILLPDITLTVDLAPASADPSVVGHVSSSEWTGMKQERIGDGQAWYYPADQTLILWECMLLPRYREDEDPAHDGNLHTLWEGFEQLLLTRFPQTEQLVTPSWEPEYGPASWEAFLEDLGYTKLSAEAYTKGVRTV